MEEISKTAEAYYKNLSEYQKQSINDIFKGLDKDGDGKISSEEYEEYIKNKFKSSLTSKLFKKLDKNGDGMLGFSEFTTVQYLFLSQRLYFCDGCNDFVAGAYFTCVQCFKDTSGNTFDLCCDCYGNRIHHHHTVFLDNYTLLHSLRNEISKIKRGPRRFRGTSSGFGGSACGGGSTCGGGGCGGGGGGCGGGSGG